MFKRSAMTILLVSLGACAHKGAVRVDCDGPLRPVNSSIESNEPPVSIETKAADGKPDEKQP